MSRYAPGYKGPMTTAGPSVPRRKPTIPAPVGGPQPFLDAVGTRRPPVNPTPVVGGQVRPTPTGPMVPVLGGGMAPASVAPMMMKKKGGKPMPVRTSQQEFSFITPGPGAIRELPYTEIMRQGREAGMAGYKKGGQVKAKKASSASKRADGCAQRGKTKGRMV